MKDLQNALREELLSPPTARYTHFVLLAARMPDSMTLGDMYMP